MTDKKTQVRSTEEALSTERALKLALESLVDNRHYIVANERTEYLEIYDKAIDAVEKALAEQPAQRKPLTDEQIINLFNEACREKFNGIERFRYFARAIEAKLMEKNT